MMMSCSMTLLHIASKQKWITGKEAVLFVPSGTMGNLVSVLVHCEVRESAVILGDNSHLHIHENGGISTIGGVHPRIVKNNDDGTMDIDLIEAAIRDSIGEIVYPTTRLICLENTHANSGGRCLPPEYIDRVGELAKKHGLKLHIDGCRIFNASIALGVPVHRLLQAADSALVCLSKGIGAPVGSVIVGSKSFINKARSLRNTLGGGMRQVGIVCAAALVALQENITKLEGDHKKAKILAEGLNQIKGLKVLNPVETNIVYFDILEGLNINSETVSKYLREHGVLIWPESSSRVRIVLHHQISGTDVQYTLSCIQVYFDIMEGSNINSETLSKYLQEHGVLIMPESSSRVRIVLHHQISGTDVQYTLSCIQQAVGEVRDCNSNLKEISECQGHEE